MLKTFLIFVTVAILSRYQSPVNCRSRKVERNFTQNVYLSLPLSYSGTGIHVVTRSVDSLQSQGAKVYRIIRTIYFLKNIMEQMTSNVVMGPMSSERLSRLMSTIR
jgi:hypothetical protein